MSDMVVILEDPAKAGTQTSLDEHFISNVFLN